VSPRPRAKPALLNHLRPPPSWGAVARVAESENAMDSCKECDGGMITITNPYRSYEPPGHLRDFAEEKRITRLCVMTSAELPDGLLVRDDVLVIPEGISEDLRDRMVRLEPYLRWAAGKEANAWLAGGPANFPPPRKPDSPGPNAKGPSTRPYARRALELEESA
jgi:hypothetical protein